MLQSFESATAGIPASQVPREYFTAPDPVGQGESFVVVLARSGRTFEIPPGRSILSVLLQAGLKLAHSCQTGICGSCETRVIAGIPGHRDSILTEAERAENKSVMICCAGSRSPRLVLDL
jgi:vanillate O-demethylase ferredoxin subunit